MAFKGRQGEWLREDVCNHIPCRNPYGVKQTIAYVRTNEMISNINVFGFGRVDRVGIVDLLQGALVVAEERERARNLKTNVGKKNPHPKGFLHRK